MDVSNIQFFTSSTSPRAGVNNGHEGGGQQAQGPHLSITVGVSYRGTKMHDDNAGRTKLIPPSSHFRDGEERSSVARVAIYNGGIGGLRRHNKLEP